MSCSDSVESEHPSEAYLYLPDAHSEAGRVSVEVPSHEGDTRDEKGHGPGEEHVGSHDLHNTRSFVPVQSFLLELRKNRLRNQFSQQLH